MVSKEEKEPRDDQDGDGCSTTEGGSMKLQFRVFSRSWWATVRVRNCRQCLFCRTPPSPLPARRVGGCTAPSAQLPAGCQGQGQHPRHGDTSCCTVAPDHSVKWPQKPSTTSGGDQYPPCLGCGQQSLFKPHASIYLWLQPPKLRVHVVEGQATQTLGPMRTWGVSWWSPMICATWHSHPAKRVLAL